MMKGKGVDAAFRYYSGKNLILSSAAKMHLIRFSSRTFEADVVGLNSFNGYWWDVTTKPAWGDHVLKYGTRGIGLFY